MKDNSEHCESQIILQRIGTCLASHLEPSNCFIFGVNLENKTYEKDVKHRKQKNSNSELSTHPASILSLPKEHCLRALQETRVEDHRYSLSSRSSASFLLDMLLSTRNETREERKERREHNPGRGEERRKS